MARTQTATMQKRLKAALPTIVEGPRSPLKSSLPRSSTTLRRISGALEPRAISVRFATVGFQTVTVVCRRVLGSRRRTRREVMCSMAPRKTSAMRATPMKHQPRPRR